MAKKTKLYICENASTETGYAVTTNKSIAICDAPDQASPGDTKYLIVNADGTFEIDSATKMVDIRAKKDLEKVNKERAEMLADRKLNTSSEGLSQEGLAKAKTFDELKKYVAYLLKLQGID